MLQMHLMPKCIWCQNAFDAKMHFGCAKMLCFLLCKKQRCVHFVLLNILQSKMFSNAVQKCIWCVAKMHFCNASNAFYFVKCSASHFPKENVQHQQNVTNAFDAKMHLMRCKNAFDALQKCIWCKNAFDAKMHFGNATHHIFLWKMFSITFSKGKCSAKQNVTNAFDALQKYIFASHFVGAKMHLMQKCIFAYILQSQMFSITFDFVKCSASHFPKENVQHQQNVTNAFDALQKYIWCKNAFLRTFYEVKCSASHFVLLNIFQRKMFSCALRCVAKMHFGIKCIWCQNAFWQRVHFTL